MKNFLNKNDFQLDEILFENRNKSYGAYALRQEADNVLIKAAFIGVTFFAMVAFVPVVINLLKTDAPVETLDILNSKHVFVNVERTEPPKPELITQQAQTNVKTIDTRVPTPAKDVTNEKPIVKQKDYNDAAAGFIDKDGDKPTTTITPPIVDIPVGPKIEQTTTIPIPVDDPNVIPDRVDIKANFVGGIDAFRNKVGEKIDPYDFDNFGETLKATVTFVVETNGSISNVKATGNNQFFNKEAEKAVQSIKGKWNPAKLNGKKVRSYFKIPLSMRFE